MTILGILLILHGAVMIGATVGGAIGYVQRGRNRDAVGVLLTVGITAIAEVVCGCFLIF